MTPAQAIGYALLNSSAISTIVGTRVNHGLRPNGTVVPCINYYELGGSTRLKGFDSVVYSINCRAATAGEARALARLIVNYFAGADGSGTYQDQGTFEITRGSLSNDGGLIPESTDGIYNAPIDVRIVYPISAS